MPRPARSCAVLAHKAECRSWPLRASCIPMTPRFGLKQRPDAGFEALYRSHVHDVYRYAMAILGNSADAEDVTQTTFLNAYRAYEAGERPRKAGNWVRAIAHNVCRQRFRQAARRPNE